MNLEQTSLFDTNNDKKNNNENNNESLKELKVKLEKLREEIEYHNKRYYEDDEPEISDYDYDKLTQELKRIEKEHPELITKTSPTQKVGGKTKNIFSQVEHSTQMQSLQDVFSFEEIEEFVDKLNDEYKNLNYLVETKIDGLSISLEYKNGKFVRGSTRGDGFVGEDVTENLRCIKDIPMQLSENIDIEVRGEVYLPREEFKRINLELEEAGKQVLSNPRNAAAGTLRQLNSKLVESRNLSIFVFTVLNNSPEFEKDSDRLDYLESLGFKVIEKRIKAENKEEVISAIKKIGELRDSLEYDIDGAVVNVDNLNVRDEIGKTVKVPKWSVAYKYPPERKETKILDIVTQVGRTGQVTPMAILNPVRVAGSIISKTTLHNFDYIKEKDIRVGDIALIEKAGDVIPEVVDVVKSKRDGTQKEYEIPTVCPVCFEPLDKEEGQVALRCTNSECPACIYRSIIHFASRDAMDISGLGESIVDALLQAGLIKDIADIYYLKYEDIFKLERFKEKSAQNLIDAITATKSNTLDKLIFGMGIRHIGKKAAKILANKYNDIYEIMGLEVEEVQSIDDFGLTMAESLVHFFKKDETKKLIEKFEKAGVNLKGSKKEVTSSVLEGKNIVVTGSFDSYKRDDIVKLIEEHSGKFVNSVSKKTDFVIAGEDAGSKLKKANDLGVKVISLEEFISMIS